MKAYDNEYYDLFKQFTNIKNILEDKIDLRTVEFSDWYEENFVDKFETLYDWTDRGFTTSNDDSEDLESMVDDLKQNDCETFADFTLLYMSSYVEKLRTFIELQNTKEV